MQRDKLIACYCQAVADAVTEHFDIPVCDVDSVYAWAPMCVTRATFLFFTALS